MFSNLILRNSRRSRKENGLFFSSLVISIVAFYMILSISTQDVMLFLQKMESDAVDKLLLLIPAFYGMTLGILFFLIHNTSVVLPKNQGKLLVALLASGDALVTTEQLCLALWGTTEYIDENALQVNLTRLKKTMSALEMKQRIVAVRGMGYRLEAEVSL